MCRWQVKLCDFLDVTHGPYLSALEIKSLIYTVCLKKNIPDIFSYNSKRHCRIFIIFGTHITEKVDNQ